MSSDYNYQIVVGWDGKIPLDEHGHHLDPETLRPVEPSRFRPLISARQVALNHVCKRELLGNRRKFQWAKELTNPYGALEYAVGNGDDFHCFDWAMLPDGRVVLHATVNSETGCFIQGAGYEVVSKEDAPNVACGMIDNAIDWLGWNDVRHSKKGWNQDPYYFYRSVVWHLDDSPDKPDFSWRQVRMGSKRFSKYLVKVA